MDRAVGIRNVFNPDLPEDQRFDPSRLPAAARAMYDEVAARIAATPAAPPEGAFRGCTTPTPSWQFVEVPPALYEAVRELYPESRPPFRARPFDVQIIGGVVLSEGQIAEMRTGEGKTIVGPLACYLAAVEDMQVHVVTVNDYLVQRDRDFTHYEDDGVFYDRRPTLWVEPRGNWGEGEVQLVEIPTEDEIHDNIVAFWTPRAAVKAGQSFALDYRLHWVDAEPYLSSAIGRVGATRRGNGGNPAVRDKASGYVKYVIDFEGGDLASRESTKNQAIPQITASRGRVVRS
jgi:hypothetical protein